MARLHDRPALLAAMPALFVLIWSTGFVVARYGMPHAPPMSFLAWRYVLSLLCLGAWVAWSGAAWPRSRAQWWHLGVVGSLMHAGYLGGVWGAIKAGASAGAVALIVGLQPLITALWVALTAARGAGAAPPPAARHWIGLLLGLAGLLLVVWRKLGSGELTAFNLSLTFLALLAITIGTLYQKRYVTPTDVRTAGFVQILAALLVSLPWALLETEPVRLHVELVGAMAWSVLVLTLGGSSLLYLLIHRGAATRVTSLLYLVPPCTALLAWVLFGEALGPAVLFGMGLAAAGVWLVVSDAPGRVGSSRGQA